MTVGSWLLAVGCWLIEGLLLPGKASFVAGTAEHSLASRHLRATEER